jgi:hypothetical protein
MLVLLAGASLVMRGAGSDWMALLPNTNIGQTNTVVGLFCLSFLLDRVLYSFCSCGSGTLALFQDCAGWRRGAAAACDASIQTHTAQHLRTNRCVLSQSNILCLSSVLFARFLSFTLSSLFLLNRFCNIILEATVISSCRLLSRSDSVAFFLSDVSASC